MYTGGPNPSANQATNAPAENTQSVQMTAGPPAPYFLPPTITQTPEVFYNMQPTPSQGCYAPIVTLASHESVVHYCDVPIEQNSSNISPEVSTVRRFNLNLVIYKMRSFFEIGCFCESIFYLYVVFVIVYNVLYVYYCRN